MGKSEQRFTQHLELDEHIQWVTEETITTDDVDRNINFHIMGFVLILIMLALVFVFDQIIYKISLFVLAMFGALAILYGRFSIPVPQDSYALTNKRLLKLKSDHLYALRFSDITTVRLYPDNALYRIECLSDAGNILTLNDLTNQQTKTILETLSEHTSAPIPSLY